MADQTKAEKDDEVLQPNHDNTILTMPVEVQEVDAQTNNEATDATTAALSSNKKKRKSLSLEDRGYRRSGKWSYQEEQYTSELMVNIANGSIPLPPGKSIRGFIAEKLECDPMRVSKKFPGTRELTKQLLQKQLEYASTPPSLNCGIAKTFPSPPTVTAPSMASHHIATTVHQLHPVSEQMLNHRQVKNTKNRPQQHHQDTTTVLPQALPSQQGPSNPSNNLGSFPKTSPAQLFQLIEHQLMLLQASLGIRPMHHPWIPPNHHPHCPHLQHHHTMAVTNTIPKQQAVIPPSCDNDDHDTSRAHKRRYTTITDTTTP